MDFKVTILLIAVCFLSFSGYWFFNPLINGTDSYAFLTVVCDSNTVKGNLGSELFFGLLPLFPCDVLVVKLFLFVCFVVCTLSIAFFGENIVGKDGWRAGLFAATLSPLLFMEVTKFENDIFGITLTCISFALFSVIFKGDEKNGKK